MDESTESLDLLDGLDFDIPEGLEDSAAEEQKQEGQFFGTFQLIQQVGTGGVAKVFRARHIHPSYAEKNFAIKVLHEELSRDPRVVELFRHEAYVLSLLKHPAIVQTFEAGSQDDKLFIAMEFIDGRDLDNMVIRAQKSRVPIPLPVSMYIIGETLKALTYAHDLVDGDGNRLNLIHRDVNPANVFLSYDGRVKLGDFGVASIAAGAIEKERQLAGKVGYFAPEQLEGGKVDHRADLFSMGVMMFEMLTGQRLFEADSADKMMRLNKKAKVPKPTKLNPDIPKGLEEAMLCALQKKASERFPTGREMLRALTPFLPPAQGMTLAVAALMRKVFLQEHIQELQMREGLAGGTHARGSGQLVSVLTSDAKAQAAFNELLRSRGYRVEVHANLPSLTQALESNAPQLMMIDVNSEGLDIKAAKAALGKISSPCPVVAVSDGLQGEWIRRADVLGAVDLLFKPFNIERVLTSVRSAVTGASKLATVEDAPSRTALGKMRPKVLILSADQGLQDTMTENLVSRGYEIRVCRTSQEALALTEQISFHAVIYDAHPATPADRFFASQFRSRPGMGLVPILYLAAAEAQSLFAGVDADRSAVRPRDDPTVVLVETLNRLRGDTRLGRTFIRYPTVFPVVVRYGGRVFEGKSADISRGGIMVRVGQMPPVGTDIAVSMKVPTGQTVEVSGRVARVDMDKQGEGHGIGIEFERFAGKGERALIAFLGTLDISSTGRRSTMIMGMSPVKQT